MIKAARPTVLLLEDEAIIAIDMEEMLEDEGAIIGASIDTCRAALAWLLVNRPDLAIVDPGLKDGSCGPVVEQLVERGIPFIVYSGHSNGADYPDPAFSKGVWLTKPSSPKQLVAAVTIALGL